MLEIGEPKLSPAHGFITQQPFAHPSTSPLPFSPRGDQTLFHFERRRKRSLPSLHGERQTLSYSEIQNHSLPAAYSASQYYPRRKLSEEAYPCVWRYGRTPGSPDIRRKVRSVDGFKTLQPQGLSNVLRPNERIPSVHPGLVEEGLILTNPGINRPGLLPALESPVPANRRRLCPIHDNHRRSAAGRSSPGGSRIHPSRPLLSSEDPGSSADSGSRRSSKGSQEPDMVSFESETSSFSEPLENSVRSPKDRNLCGARTAENNFTYLGTQSKSWKKLAKNFP